MRHFKCLLVLLLLGAVLGGIANGPAGATGSCSGGLTPSGSDDSTDINDCLAAGGVTKLTSGATFLIAHGLNVVVSNTTFTSTVPGQLATIQAMSSLTNAMLTSPPSGVDHLLVQYIAFDGNRASRLTLAGAPSYLCRADMTRTGGTNVYIRGGDQNRFLDNHSDNALCGSALFVASNYAGMPHFEVGRNTLTGNGNSDYPDMNPKDPYGVAIATQSDGITIGNCNGGNIHHNTVINATDAAIVSFTSENHACSISSNTVQQLDNPSTGQTNNHADNGLSLGVSGTNDGLHNNTVMENNTVIGDGRLSIGIEFGTDAYFGNGQIARGGVIRNNTVSGAYFNLDVEGTQGGSVSGNNLGAAMDQVGGPPQCVINHPSWVHDNNVAYPPEALATVLQVGFTTRQVECMP